MSERRLIIAIDGPSGAGKGTIARTLAAQLGYTHIDTGAMYRAVAWLARHEGVDLADEARVAALASRDLLVADGVVQVDGHDVTTAIRTPDMDTAAASVSRHPAVRQVLVARQRRDGAEGGVVMEGRDIGTVVFPAADVKLYLDASPEERARRRASDAAHAASAERLALAQVAAQLEARDTSDRTRATSPLMAAADAVSIDTTGVPIADVLDRVLTIVRAKLAAV